MTQIVRLIVLAAFLLRLGSLRRFWRLPLRHGPEHLFAVSINDRSQPALRNRLLHDYRRALLVVLALDASAMIAMVASGNAQYLLHEQFVAVILTAVAYNLTLIRFAARARRLAPVETEQRITSVQVSLERRRLADHSRWSVEAAIAVAVLVTAGAVTAEHRWTRPVVLQIAWVVYMQVGLLLLKNVFVQWRLRLPMRRTEEFLRWRDTWLTYHCRVFDSMRLLCALALLHLGLRPLLERAFGTRWFAVIVAEGILVVAIFLAYNIREQRRLRAVEREIRPVELVKEFPPPRLPEGRFLGGGLFGIDANNPAILMPSPTGLAVNLANSATYLWTAYLAGFVGLVVLIARQSSS